MAQYENLTGWEKLSLGKQLDKWAVQYGDRIEKCCDYVMFMDKGGVIDVGTIEEERLHRIKKFFRV